MSFVMVIDDNRLTAEALVQMLKLWKIESRVALNPATALAMLETDIPRLVFLDINMPGLNGFEVLAYLKREPRLMGVPVIIVTSDDQPETSRKAIKNGACALIVKPIMPDLLEQELSKVGIL